jgi:signal transduction histidine kinase
LPYPQKSVTFEFASYTARTFPEQVQYGFVLLDGKGQLLKHKVSRDPQFVAEGLKPGRYALQAFAFTKDLTVSPARNVELTVEGAPFPWFTLLLGVLLALSLAALWWGYCQNRQLAGANQQVAEAREQLAHEAETERRRIARDLHDQTLADLRRLALMTDELPAGEKGAHFRAEIEGVSKEIRRICEDLSPSALENIGLAAALEFALSQAVAQAPPEQTFEYEFACADDFEERLTLTPAEQIQVFRIAQEAVANVSRHARARRVEARAEVDDDGAFVFTLEDDGAGFTPDAPHHEGRGLANIRARAGLLNAATAWTPRDGGGTIFRLTKEPPRPV